MTDETFERVARTYGDMLYRVAYHALKNRADAEDVAQTVLLKLYQQGDRFESEEHRKHWLLRVAVNESRKVLRSFWRRRAVSLDEQRDEAAPEDSAQREVFEAVRDRIVAYSATPEYRKRLTEVARQTVDTLKGAGDIVICLRPEDMDQSDAIAAALDGVKVEFKADNRILMGGLTASSPSLGRRVDATFGTAMEELNGHFAEIFGLSLSDDLTETVE